MSLPNDERSKKSESKYSFSHHSHHISFFPNNPADRSEADGSGNCLAGSVTGESLAPKNSREFFLLSHSGIQGTSRPSHYIVIHDDIFWASPDELKHFSYGLCHVYAKATQSVSIPTPIYYAHHACTRALILFEDPKSTVTDTEGEFDLADWRRWFLGAKEQNNPLFFL